jgi:hypothetical protein
VGETVVAVPASFDDVTLGWLVAALDQGGAADNLDIDSVVVEPLVPNPGLFGDLAVVRIGYGSGTGPESLLLKLPSANEENRRIAQVLNAYGREVAFYHHVAPKSAGARVPTCYYAAAEPAHDRWAVLIDFIDGDPTDAASGADRAQAHAAVDALADFHGMWWDAKTVFDWMPGIDQGGLGGLAPIWAQNLPTFVDRYRQQLPGPTGDWALAFTAELADWSNRAATEPLTMVHADYRIDNLVFQGGQVTMIDWQTAMRAPAAMDLSCFLITSLAFDARRRDEEALIDRYLDRLSGSANEVDRDWFRTSYDENILWWMGQFGNNLAHLEPPTNTVADALSLMVERVFTAGLDRNVGRLLSAS